MCRSARGWSTRRSAAIERSVLLRGRNIVRHGIHYRKWAPSDEDCQEKSIGVQAIRHCQMPDGSRGRRSFGSDEFLEVRLGGRHGKPTSQSAELPTSLPMAFSTTVPLAGKDWLCESGVCKRYYYMIRSSRRIRKFEKKKNGEDCPMFTGPCSPWGHEKARVLPRAFAGHPTSGCSEPTSSARSFESTRSPVSAS